MSVKNSYNTIAKEFSQTRKHSWPEFEIFLGEIKKLKDQRLKMKDESVVNNCNRLQKSEWQTKKLKILDIGCGNWRFLQFLKTKDYNLKNIEYTWIDLSEEMIKEAKKLHPEFDFKIANMTKLPFETWEFDVIIPIASFHHLNSEKDRLKTLSEFKRVLKKGWIICITNWNLFQKKYWKSFFRNFWQKKSWNDTFVPFSSWWKIKTIRYYHAFTPNELRELFKESWFRIIKEFFIKKWKQKENWKESFNICHVLRVE